MENVRAADTGQFPRYGARARTWSRFERDLREWLATPEGRFAAWRATQGERATAPSPGPEPRTGS